MLNPSDTLLARYLSGDCTDAEAREVERWAAADPVHQAELEQLRVIAKHPWPSSPPNIDAMWAGLQRTMRRDGDRSARFERAFQAERRRWWTVPVAAAAVVAVVGGATVITKHTQQSSDSLESSFAEYVTPRGQRATFRLADGTSLVLAADTRLRVPAGYGQQVREVHLEGEALFDVVHDTTRPFRVRAKDALATDIGTRFNVRARREDSVVTVAVAEGAVALGRPSDAAQGVVLREGELGTLATDGRVTTASGDVAAAAVAWAEGRLKFVRVPLADVASELGRWYDLDVRVDGTALASLPITAEFGMQSLDELLRELALAAEARVVRAGKTVTLQAK